MARTEGFPTAAGRCKPARRHRYGFFEARTRRPHRGRVDNKGEVMPRATARRSGEAMRVGGGGG